MAGVIGKPRPKLLLVHPDDSATDTDDSDDDLSLCDLPIRAPSAPSFTVSSPSAAKDVVGADCNRLLSVLVDEASSGDVVDGDNDPFEFLSTRHEPGMCSPSAVFSGGRMFPTLATPPSTSNSTASPLLNLATTKDSTSGSNHDYTGSFPPRPMSRRSRSEALRMPPREDPAAYYNRSASVEGRGGRARRAGLGAVAGKKAGGAYRHLPPLQAGPATSTPFGSSASNRKTSGAAAAAGVDPVPSCGPRPKWYVFATFATVKPPQGGMDIKDIRTRQKKRNTQQQQQSADGGVISGLPATTTTRLAAAAADQGRRGRKSWLLNSLSCRVDVDALAWSPSDPPMPLP